jgi:excisionase family DNA binding protein
MISLVTMTTSPLLVVPVVADDLGVSRMTVYRLIRSGRLPAVRLGTGDRRGQMIRVRAADLERFIATREAESCPQ